MISALIQAGHRLGLRRSAAARPPFRNGVRLLARLGWLPLSAIGGIPVREAGIVTMSGGASFRYNFDHLNDPVGEYIYWRGFGAYEPSVMSRYLELAATAGCILDIGANTGLFSLAACAVNASVRVIAWEPVPSIEQRLRANVAINGFDDRVDCHCAALGGKAGTARLRILSDCSTSASLAEVNFGVGREATFLDVPVETGDAVAGSRHVDLIKIDVETAETIVLSGMTGILRASRPVVIAECLPAASERTRGFLTAAGYRGEPLDDSTYLFTPIDENSVTGPARGSIAAGSVPVPPRT